MDRVRLHEAWQKTMTRQVHVSQEWPCLRIPASSFIGWVQLGGMQPQCRCSDEFQITIAEAVDLFCFLKSEISEVHSHEYQCTDLFFHIGSENSYSVETDWRQGS